MLARVFDIWSGLSAIAGAFLRHSGFQGVRAAMLVALAAALDGVSILLLIPMLGTVVGQGSPHLTALLIRAGATTPSTRLGVLVAAFLGVALLRLAINFLRDLSLNTLQTGFIETERNRLLTQVAAAPWSRILQLRHTDVTNLLSMEVARVGSALQLLLQVTVALVMLVSQTIIAFAIAPTLTLALLLLFLGGAVLFAVGGVHLGRLGNELVQANRHAMATSGLFLQGLKTAAAQNAQARFLAEYESSQRRAREVVTLFARRTARSRLLIGITTSVIAAATVYLGFAVFHVAPALLITVLVIFARMSGPMTQVFQSGQQLVFTAPSFQAVRAFGATLQRSAEDAGAPVLPPPGPITLDRASYLHDSGGGLRAATLAIPPGAFVGVSGPSGAGKTTLIDLIVGLLEPQSGGIAVGGQPLDAGHRRGWASQIAYVAQEGFLFHDSVRRNLTWNTPDATDADIAAALALAGATRIVERLPEGLETVIGERGTLLSGGERQRLGIARALLARPRLLVLDEAANAIDADGESELLARLAALPDRPTILMISHRDASLRFCDMVIAVQDGVATVLSPADATRSTPAY